MRSSSHLQINRNRLNATCISVTFTLKLTPSLNTTQVHATLETLLSDKVINIGFPLANDAFVCKSELKTSSITFDVNTQIITRKYDLWTAYNNNSDCLIVCVNFPFDYCNDETLHFKISCPVLMFIKMIYYKTEKIY